MKCPSLNELISTGKIELDYFEVTFYTTFTLPCLIIMTNYKLVIDQSSQKLYTPVSTPLDENAYHEESISINDLRELTGIVINRGKNGTISSIEIPIPTVIISKPINVADITDMKTLQQVTLKKLENGNYKSWLKYVSKACFKEDTLQNIIFQIIRKQKEISRSELGNILLTSHDYQESGSTNGALQALRDVLCVIREEERNGERWLIYIGNV